MGETTGGGAHPVSSHRIDDHFTIGVPFASAINPISKTSWEGPGVEPDMKVPAAEALATAQKLPMSVLRRKDHLHWPLASSRNSGLFREEASGQCRWSFRR